MPSIPGEWHFDGFSEVRAFRINWEERGDLDMPRLVLADGTLNPRRIPKDGVALDEDQVARLRDAVCSMYPEHLVADCFYPHHAFLFLDDEGEIVGSIDICFLCSNYRGTPDGFSNSWNIDALKALVVDLGMPVENPQW